MATRAGAIGNLPWVRGTSFPGVKMAPRGAEHKAAINTELAAEATKIGGKQFIQKYGLASWTAINSIDTQNQEFEKNIKDIEYNEKNFSKYNFLLKLFDKADIINQINLTGDYLGLEVPAETINLEASSKVKSR